MDKCEYYQEYIVHLKNGEEISVAEKYFVPFEKGFIADFEKSPEDKLFVFGDKTLGFHYVPKRSILYIRTNDVRKEWK